MNSQISLFDGSVQFVVDKPVRLIELFAGIGSQAKALERLGVDFEHWRICEFDKYAVCAYNAIHGTSFEPSDITKLSGAELGIADTESFCYILTYSFPCQDLSKAGKGKGMEKNSGTRSGLLWEVERLLGEVDELPQVLLMENVPDVLGAKNAKHFYLWCQRLEEMGYHNYYKVLNAKDFTVPQNRERCFMVSVLGDYFYEFPDGVPLKLRLKDMLEKKVPEKYYLSKTVTMALMQAINDRHEAEKLAGGGSLKTSSPRKASAAPSERADAPASTAMPGTASSSRGVMLSECGRRYEGNCDVASTLLARDYKGFGNQAMTAVMEMKTED